MRADATFCHLALLAEAKAPAVPHEDLGHAAITDTSTFGATR
jgi:hypothetical protein